VSDPNLFTLELQWDEDDAQGYQLAYKRVGPLVGAQQLGLSVYELPPGNSICPYHYEVGREEWLLVLVGRPTLRTPGGEHQLRPWDVAFFPGDEGGAHKVTNRTDQTVRIAMLSTTADPNVTVYPDSEKVGAWPPGKTFTLDSAVDYFQGEV
jgi:uncharacterized cupin superfamily protein